MASNDDLLFAEHAVKAGFVNDEQVSDSLRVQERMAEMGVAESLRNVLVKRGVLREGDAAVVSRAAGLRSGREPIPGYTLEARVGTGAMGSVYRAYQRAMKRHVAIKILRRDLTDDPRQVERLQREAALVGKLDHPHIVRGLDCGQSDGLVWFVMEYVEGRTLQARIRTDGPLEVDAAIDIALKMAEALSHAHAHGIVHRDIKPGNILLTTDDEPRLTDYGLAKGESDDALTHLDATLGTPQYISPEQARNPRDADTRSDIYSLGATFYAMLAGRPPFHAESLAATLTKVLYERPMPLAEAAPDTPREVVYVVERMMAKDRRHRYTSPDELVRDLRALQAGRLHVPAAFSGDIETFVAARRRSRLWTAAVATAAVAVAAVTTALVWNARTERGRQEGAAIEDLSAVLALDDGPGERDGATVERMLRGLEAHLARHPDAPTEEEARAELAHWQRQAEAIERVQKLRLRASAETIASWPALLADLRAETARMGRDPDADVALARLRSVLTDVEAARDRRARDESRAARAAVAGRSLLEASADFALLSQELRDTFYGLGDAPEADAALRLSEQFRRAQTALDGHFANYDANARRADLPSANLRDLERQLFEALDAADSDAELARLLAELPPVGQRRRVLAERYAQSRERLEAVSARRWDTLRSEAERLFADRRYAEAEALLESTAPVLLTGQRDAALAERERIRTRRQVEEREVVAATADYAAKFIGALGRRDYRDASDQLTELASYTAGWSDEGGVADRMVQQGRHLLDLIDARAWEVFRRKLRSGTGFDSGLRFGAGIRYDNVRDVRLVGDELAFTYGDGLGWRGGVRAVDLADLLGYAGLPGTDPEGSLVASALWITETSPDDEPAVVLARMAAVEPHLETARRVREMDDVIALLGERRRDLEGGVRAQLAETEERARALHDEARRNLASGRYGDAWTQLDSLLTLRRLWRTDYVRRRRDEIERERDRASEGRETVRYAKRLPGARLVERGDGTASLIVDFEDPDVERAVALTAGRSQLALRHRVAANVPAQGDDLGVVEDRVFEWLPWDGDPEHHPRLSPLSVSSPFQVRRRVDVSFLYRSDAPFFLLVSIGGTNVGVLSADDVREAGRGVVIWQDASLDAPDAQFTERHRSEYLARHPEILEREGDGAFFGFAPGRVYRVRFVKDERRAALWVDGRKLLEEDLRVGAPAGDLRDRVIVQSYTSGEVDDVVITGLLDPEWLRAR